MAARQQQAVPCFTFSCRKTRQRQRNCTALLVLYLVSALSPDLYDHLNYKMTAYQKVDLRELIEDRDINCVSLFAGQKIETSGRIELPYGADDKPFLYGILYSEEKYFGLNGIWMKVTPGRLWKRTLEKKIEDAWQKNAPVIARGRYKNFENPYLIYSANFLALDEIEMLEGGTVSLVKNNEGSLTIAEEGKISLK